MNEKVIGLIRTVGVLLLFVIGIIMIYMASGTDAEIDKDTQLLVETKDTVSGAVNYTTWLVYGALALIAGFTIWAIVQNPKRFITPAIGIVVFLVLGGIAYAMASDAIIADLIKEDGTVHANMTQDSLKWSGTGIKMTFILVIVAVAAILASSVMGAMRYFSSK